MPKASTKQRQWGNRSTTSSGPDAPGDEARTVRVHISATRTTELSFALRMKTRGDGRVGALRGNRMAVGMKPSERNSRGLFDVPRCRIFKLTPSRSYVTPLQTQQAALDKPRCHCAVFGIYGHPAAAHLTYYGLLAQQHRGQEGSGIVSAEFDPAQHRPRFHVHKDFGLVNDVYADDRILTDILRGTSAIGHNRYSTAGAANNKSNVQPFTVLYRGGNLAIGHNGNLTNFREIRKAAPGNRHNLPDDLRHGNYPPSDSAQQARGSAGSDSRGSGKGGRRVLPGDPRRQPVDRGARQCGRPSPRHRPERRGVHRRLGDRRV